MRVSLYLFLLVFSLPLISQEFIVKGRISDAVSGKLIQDCHIRIANSEDGVVSNLRGEYQLLVPATRNQVMIVYSYLGYKELRRSIDLSEWKAQVFELDVVLDIEAISLPEVPILSEKLPEIVYANEQHSVEDFEFIDDFILLLAYPKRLQKSSMLYLVDLQMRHVDSLEVPIVQKSIELVRDYTGIVYLKWESGLYKVEIEHERLSLALMNYSLFQESVEPIVDTIDSGVLFSTWTERYPAFDYYLFDTKDSSYSHIRQICDQQMLEFCRAEYKYLSSRDKLKMFRLELETGIEKEIITCVSSFEAGIYYRPIYAPMFVVQDRLYLFDHASDLLLVYDQQANQLDSFPIGYNDPNKVLGNPFANKVICDKETGNIYAVFQKPGGKCSLQEVDLTTGKTSAISELSYDYPSQIQIKSSEVYYTYRPFESQQKKHLYKESL